MRLIQFGMVGRWRKYRAIHAKSVATAMVAMAKQNLLQFIMKSLSSVPLRYKLNDNSLLWPAIPHQSVQCKKACDPFPPNDSPARRLSKKTEQLFAFLGSYHKSRPVNERAR